MFLRRFVLCLTHGVSAWLNLSEEVVFISGGALFSQKVILYLNQFFTEIEEDSGGLEAEGIGDIMIHEDCLWMHFFMQHGILQSGIESLPS